MFEYIFYRLYLTCKKHEPNTNPSFSATLALSAFQICMVGGVMIVLSGVFGIDVLPKNSVVGKIIALVFTALLALYNYKRYSPKIGEMDEKYANYKANKWFRTWMLYILSLLALLVPIALSRLINGLQ